MEKKYTLPLHPLATERAVVAGEKYRFTVLTDRLIRMEYQEEGKFTDAATQKVICREFPVPAFRVIETENTLEIVTDKLHMYYDKKPFSGEGLSIQLNEGFHVYGSAWNFGDPNRTLKGTARTLDGVDGATELEEGLLSRQGFTVLDDSQSALLGEDMWPVSRRVASTDLYFFGYGHDYLGCLRDFYRLSGPTPLLPKFALGNWWSRFYRYSEESYLALMDKFREKGIPFSTAVIDMDWHLTDIPRKYGSGWTGYTWNPELFPNPKRFMDKLHDLGMKVTLNVHPADGVRAHEEAYLPMAKALGVDYENEDRIPFDIGNRDFIHAYFRYLHHPNEARGVDFWWLDWQQGNRGSTTGIDTLWLLNHLHFLDSGRGGKQPLTFSRYAGIGSHRYPVGFSGDTYTTWDSLAFQPYFTATASNAGYTWWSHDIGGHQGGRRDDELAVRWLQFGVFSPIMRLHSTSNAFYGKEPWNYSLPAQGAMVRFLRLRHQLIPYLYSMNYLTHLKGLPLMQPMYYHHEEDAAYQVPNQYYFGTEMIVCPITRPADKETLLAEVEAWLPEGQWIDFFTGQCYRGGKKLRLYRGLDSIPVLVKAGGIIPMDQSHMRSHLENPGELEIHIFAGGDGDFTLYEDLEGNSPITTDIRFRWGKTAEIRILSSDGVKGIIPENRSYTVTLHGISRPEEVRFLTENKGDAVITYDADAKLLRICFCPEQAGDVRLQVVPEAACAVAPDQKARIQSMLQAAQIAYDQKVAIYEAVSREENTAKIFAELYRMRLNQPLMDVLIEMLTGEM